MIYRGLQAFLRSWLLPRPLPLIVIRTTVSVSTTASEDVISMSSSGIENRDKPTLGPIHKHLKFGSHWGGNKGEYTFWCLWWKLPSKLTLWQFFKKENPQFLLRAERYLKQKSVTKVVRNTPTEIGRKYTRNLHSPIGEAKSSPKFSKARLKFRTVIARKTIQNHLLFP